MWRDNKKSETFRKQDSNEPRIVQPQMEANLDVKRHESEVAQGGNWLLKAENIVKIYDNGLLAVTGNTFGVAKGSILGLLGPNGAGKSSTFSMLAMEQPITQGAAYVLNQDTKSIDLGEEGRVIGMCPQYNPIWN